MSIEASPTAATIQGLQAPAVAASAAGNANTALPMTWLTPTAVRSQRPSSRFSAGVDDVLAGGCTAVVVPLPSSTRHEGSRQPSEMLSAGAGREKRTPGTMGRPLDPSAVARTAADAGRV